MIKTTVVGSYPVPMWLRVVSNRESLRDAMMAVIKTQELAGIDVVADGELYRWDINHAETNGMIDYFIRPLDGISTELSFQELEAWRSRQDMQYRAKPAGLVRGPIGPGVGGEVIDRDVHRLSTLQALQVPDQQLGFERVGMVEVDDVALGVGQVGQIAVVGVVGQECDALRSNSRQDDVGDGGLARSGAAADPDHQRGLRLAHLKPPEGFEPST